MANKLALAIALAAEGFKDVLDKGGKPYMLHCLWVMDNTDGDECTKCAAVMHDLVEDQKKTGMTMEKLATYGFSAKTMGLMHLVTHEKDTEYMAYIRAIAVNADARKIKIADLRHNTDITRLKGLGEKDFARLIKYHQAYVYLRD